MYPKDSEGIDPSQLITDTAFKGSFDHIVLEQGEIESSENEEILCEVRARNTTGTPIIWVIDEGTPVEKGDKLVELDTANFEIQEKEQRIQVITEEARVAQAQAALEQAKIAKREYEEGIFKTEEANLESERQVALQNEEIAKLAMRSSERLVAKGLVKNEQLKADLYSLQNAQTLRKAAEARLKVLRELTKEKFLVQYEAAIKTAQTELDAAKAELVEEQNELDEILDQIQKCTIYAPAPGVVVHANKFSSRGGSAEFVVEAGAILRERQEIIRLPNPEKMQVKCDVNESRVTLIEPNMPVKIRVDAIPGLELKGRVRKVNRYAEPGSWYSSSIKEYATYIEILDPPPSIRTGMTAEAQIFVEQLEDALQIPVEGLYEHGGDLFSLVQRGENLFETVKVDLNATNDTMACIGGEGIGDSDRIVLNLRDHLSLMDLPELDEADASDEMRSLAKQFQKDFADTRQVSGRGGTPGGVNRDGPSRGNFGEGQRGGRGRGPGGGEGRAGGNWQGKGGGKGNWQGKGGQASSGASLNASAKASS